MMSLMIVLALGFIGALGVGKWAHWPHGAHPAGKRRVEASTRGSLDSGFPIVVLASLSVARNEGRR
jgi:hypothetical protein